MALTLYSGSTNIIGSLGTNPAERGLTTQEFKDKFDQFAEEFVAWFNGTHIGEVESLLVTTPMARAYKSASQSINTGTFTAIAFDTESFDTDTIHDNATNNTRFTCKTAGKYLIIGQIAYDSNATGYRAAFIKHNNTTYIGKSQIAAFSGDQTIVSVSSIYDLAINDYVELTAYQTSGGALNALGGVGTIFQMTRVD